MSLTWHGMYRSCQVANQRVPGMNLLPPPQHCRLQGQRHTPSCPPIWYGFWGANSGSQAHKVCTVLPTDSPRKGLLAGEIIQSPTEPQSTSQASNILTPWLFVISALAGQSFNETWASCIALPHRRPFAFWMGVHFCEKEPFFFCLHLNSLKMNDYNISFSLPLLSNTESTLNLRSLYAKKPTTTKLIWNLCLCGCNFTEEKNLVQLYQLLGSQPLPNATKLWAARCI